MAILSGLPFFSKGNYKYCFSHVPEQKVFPKILIHVFEKHGFNGPNQLCGVHLLAFAIL